MDFWKTSVFLDLLILNFSYCYVILSGGPYCSTDGYSVSHAVPGAAVSITCAVDNPDGATNGLTWSIPSFGVMLTNTAVDNTVDGTELKSTVTYSDSGKKETNATLSFLAVSVLDKATVQCRNNDNPPQSRNCTLYIRAPPTDPTVPTVPTAPTASTVPTAPTSFMCANTSFDSLILQWGEPTDNGGEEVSQYNITGTPGDINVIVNGSNHVVTVENLLPNSKYGLSIRAGNTVGFGNSTSVECTTTHGNRPPKFDNVMVCLDVSSASPVGEAKLDVIYSPCPLVVTDQLTPEVMSYRVVVGGSDIPAEDVLVHDTGSCHFSTNVSTNNVAAYTVDVYANNSVGSTKTTYRNGAVFHASWLRDIKVTDVTSSSAVIQYTTADCVLSSNLIVELISPIRSEHTYENETTSYFSLTSLSPDRSVAFSLIVVVESKTVYSRTSYFILSPISPTSLTTPSTTGNTESSSHSARESSSHSARESSSHSARESSSHSARHSVRPSKELNTAPVNVLHAVGGVFGGSISIALTVTIILAILSLRVCLKKKRYNFTLGPVEDIIPLAKVAPRCETEQALYKDSTTNEDQQPPTADMYTLPDKPRRQPPPPIPPSATETATNQDPNTIERQEAPTGDLYTICQKKPQYSEANEENKSCGAMSAKLGFEDSSQPSVSPSGQPLLPEDTTQVMHAEVRDL